MKIQELKSERMPKKFSTHNTVIIVNISRKKNYIIPVFCYLYGYVMITVLKKTVTSSIKN